MLTVLISPGSDRIILPVFTSLAVFPTEVQQVVGRLAVKTLCDSWLEHIYQKKIKFRFDLSLSNIQHFIISTAVSPEPNSSWQTSLFCDSGWSHVNTSLRTPGGERGGRQGLKF